MPSLKTLTFIATVALSAFTSVSARPVALSGVGLVHPPVVEVAVRNYPPAPTNVPTPSEPAAPTAAPAPPAPSASTVPTAPAPSQPESLVTIIEQLTTAITPTIEELGKLTKDTATADVIGPLVQTINAALNVAIGKVNALLGQPIGVVLATVNGVLDIGGLIKLLQPLLTLVFTALGAVLNIVGTVEGEVFGLLQSVGSLVGQLLQLILEIVGGLAGGLLGTVLGVVGPLLTGTVLPVLNQLGLTEIVGSLSLPL